MADLTFVSISPELSRGLELIEKGEMARALHFFETFSEKEPHNPLAKSFLGYLTAAVHKRSFQGLELCLEAVKQEREEPLLYLNLARVYVLMNDRYHAVQAVQSGLRYRHSPFRNNLMSFYRSMGVRRKPPLNFLHRNNPLNVIIGKMIRKKK